jgi:tetratricopeptide (TPR) repeat protein
LPSDATLHEFRALCLFALKRYKEAAAGVYAVLAAGPGWDWDTMKALYPDVATYTAQLRALEQYKIANPTAPDASFLLAYQYLVMGYPDQAQKELEQVVKLQPNDKLAAAILDALKNRGQANPAGQGPPKPEPL